MTVARIATRHYDLLTISSTLYTRLIYWNISFLFVLIEIQWFLRILSDVPHPFETATFHFWSAGKIGLIIREIRKSVCLSVYLSIYLPIYSYLATSIYLSMASYVASCIASYIDGYTATQGSYVAV